MKKYLYLLPLVFLSAFAAAQEVPETQKSLIIKRTATWCPPCGGWGWDLFENLIEDNEENAILWAMHYSGDLLNPTAQGINSILSGSSQPKFYLNTVEVMGSSASANSMRTSFKDDVLENATNAPIANAIATNLSIYDNTLSLTVKSKFFAQANGEYFLNVYVVENGVLNSQAGRPNAIHEKVLRGDMVGDAFGDVLTSGMVAMNTEFSTDLSIPIATSWNVDNLELSVVIWKKNGNKYDFVNGTKMEHLVLATNRPTLSNTKMTIAPNVISDFATLTISTEEVLQSAISIYDINGRMVKSFLKNKEINPTSIYTQVLDLSDLTKGIYFVRLLTDKGQLSQKIIMDY